MTLAYLVKTLQSMNLCSSQTLLIAYHFRGNLYPKT